MEKTLKIYYTSDTHGRVFPEDSGANPCLTQAFAEYEKDENTLVLEGGDTLQGSPLLRYLWKTEQCHQVMVPVMNAAKLDYYTLGNHDFNYGYDGLAGYVNGLQATCLCANVVDENAPKQPNLAKKNGGEIAAQAGENTAKTPTQILPYAIHTLGNGMRVGLVGIVTDYVNLWEAEENLTGLTVTDPFLAAKNALNALHSVENGVDYTICIYHGGFEADISKIAPDAKAVESSPCSTSKTQENIGCKICRELAFDLLLTAHQHMEQPLRMLYGTAVLQLPPNAEKYAALEITVDENGSKKMVQALHVTATAQPDKALLATMQPLRDAATAWLAQPAGSLAKAAPAVQDKVRLAIEASPVVHLANFAQLEASGAEVAITSLPNQAVGLPQQMTIGDVLTAYPFPNAVITLAVPGAVLAQGIARSASYFAKDAAGKLCVASAFVSPKEEHYNYDFFAGVSYTISFAADATPCSAAGTATAQPVAAKVEGVAPAQHAQPVAADAIATPVVTEILVNGEPLDPARVYQVVMSDYRATGTGGYGFYANCPRLASHPCDVQALILETVAQHPVFEVPVLSAVKVIQG